MPANFQFPGVYVAEVPARPPTIVAVPTSITAFVGAAPRGPDAPVAVRNLAEYERVFGSVSHAVPLSLAVRDFFAHGGNDAVVVRVSRNGVRARVDLVGGMSLMAINAGTWGNALSVEIVDRANAAFDLIVREAGDVAEVFDNVTIGRDDRRYVGAVLAKSSLVTLVVDSAPTHPPAAPPVAFAGGSDGDPIVDDDIAGAAAAAARRGLYALDAVDLFNLLCIPPLAPDRDIGRTTRDAALRYARTRRAMVVLDAPMAWTTAGEAAVGFDSFADPVDNGALYFPGLVAVDPTDGVRRRVAACGAVAGVIARTDAARGVWKSPSGSEAQLAGMPATALDDDENSTLYARGINCIRTFSGRPTMVWGGRTLAGGSDLASEYKYIAVRRLGWFIEASVERGSGWAAFETADDTIRVQLDATISAYMLSLFHQGAFQGNTPAEAFFVRSDRTAVGFTVLIGFAPLKPAEFVILRLSVG